MITMEFDELKKVWDSQNKEPMYVIDEQALHQAHSYQKKSRPFGFQPERVWLNGHCLSDRSFLDY